MIQLKAWAKINIGLKILNKRDDGFHNIETTLSTINLADFITLEKTGGAIEIESHGLDCSVEDNLCYQSADLFRKTYNIKSGVKIDLVKNIPVGGGLGGGSSDAACVLRGMRKLFDLDMPDEELMDVARQIGSDVPFFIKGGAAYARGRGDELKFFKLPKMSLIVYYPGYPISTKWAYEEYDKLVLTSTTETDSINHEEKKKRRKGFELENSFERVVFKKHPDLLDVKVGLFSTGTLMVLLSGSGSCLFTLVDEGVRKKAIKYLEEIGAQFFEVGTI
jgi:4-diphosphocytidyl-2-C-methyl-D-erythritol kinase